MTPPAPPTVNALPPRVAAAACRYALGLRPLGPDARATITAGGTGSEMRTLEGCIDLAHVTECVAVLRADAADA